MQCRLSGLKPKKAEIDNRLRATSGIAAFRYSRFILSNLDTYLEWRIFNDQTGEQNFFTCLYVDSNYMRTMGINIVQGRSFNERDSNCFIVNEATQRRWPYIKPGYEIGGFTVVGVCKDIGFTSVHKTVIRNRWHLPYSATNLKNGTTGWAFSMCAWRKMLTGNSSAGRLRKSLTAWLANGKG